MSDDSVLTLPEDVAARVKSGHMFKADHPGHSPTKRWTCTVCGDAVLSFADRVYGGATERTCEESMIFWGRATKSEPKVANEIPSLVDVVANLHHAYSITRRQLQSEINIAPWSDETVTPEMMRDRNGRFILLDALVALTNATVALEKVNQTKKD